MTWSQSSLCAGRAGLDSFGYDLRAAVVASKDDDVKRCHSCCEDAGMMCSVRPNAILQCWYMAAFRWDSMEYKLEEVGRCSQREICVKSYRIEVIKEKEGIAPKLDL